MRYQGMPAGMWLLFVGSFRDALSDVLKYDSEKSVSITRAAKSRYREIISGLPEFEKGDRFKVNIVSAAMFAAFYLQMDPRPDVNEATEFYKQGMMNPVMKQFCRISARQKFSAADIEGMKKTAALKAADRNPYSWNMDFYPYKDRAGYEARFTKCGICTLLRELNMAEAIPAMCRLDYTMSEAGGVSVFVREHTLAEGGPYCDCGYQKKV